MTSSDDYFQYLTQRSRLALVYRRRWLYPRLDRELQGRVIDIGCGIGDFLAFRPNTIGVDINPKLVAHCRAQGLEAEEIRNGALPFEDSAFDGAVLDNVLEHIAKPAPLLAEAHRVIRTGGSLVVGVPGARGYRADPDHKVYYDAPRLIATLRGAGFSLRKIFHMPIRFPFLDHLLSQHCLYASFSRID